MARRTGSPITYALAQAALRPDRVPRTGSTRPRPTSPTACNIVPQVACRPTGMLFGLQSSLHPFITHPTYRTIADLPLAERVARLAQPETRAALLAEGPGTDNPIATGLMQRWAQMFPLGDPPDYEPPASASAGGDRRARRAAAPRRSSSTGCSSGTATALLFAPLASYVDHDFEAIREMVTHPRTVLGLSDGGAHCGLICDASMPTFLLTHWARDRSRGERLPVELAVHLQTGRTAALYGFDDRGTLEVGKRADLNVVDHDNLRLHAPEMVFDLPAGGRRLVQKVDGYRTTMVAGEVTFENGEATGARPGRLVRA